MKAGVVFRARYGTLCRLCDYPIQPGQQVRSIDRYGELVHHPRCPMPDKPAAMCPRCDRVHYVDEGCQL